MDKILFKGCTEIVLTFRQIYLSSSEEVKIMQIAKGFVLIILGHLNF